MSESKAFRTVSGIEYLLQSRAVGMEDPILTHYTLPPNAQQPLTLVPNHNLLQIRSPPTCCNQASPSRVISQM